MQDKNINVDITEDQDTFIGNAKKKAIEIYKLLKEEVIADDSGLCINCLNGFPGVITHRFLGENASDIERNEYLINGVNKYNDRSAQVVCIIVYYDWKDFIILKVVLNGFIAYEASGNNGFGFDSIFELSNGLTLAELSFEEKNSISARSIAIKKLVKKIS